ncbi:MAG TPA: exodeoxyribonuclease VII large subunit [Kofleriaceae bacterium]|nr:exodeoxyribonuclease VII large subunit [Kofleriaceae bacterium]
MAAPQTSSREQPLAVSEVVRLAGRTLDELGILWLEGEISQISRPASGHVYFSLRDQNTVLPAVLWARDAARLRFVPEPGQRLRVRGRMGVYDRDGKMQLYADFLEPAGQGNAALALALLKEKLAAEGLFAPEKKRPLPRFPRRIGVVTSKTGAAVHDIIRTIQRRFPTPILIADCSVQGPAAPRQIMAAMAMAVRAGVDVLIVGRGGGAVTDLSAFNVENVVRTVSRCPVPVISAVGHEIDLSLCDLAADARASTPTAAAELAVPVAAEIQQQLSKDRRRLDREVRMHLDRARMDLDARLRDLSVHLGRSTIRHRATLRELERRLHVLHPRQQLSEQRAALSSAERTLLQLGQSRLAEARATLRELERRLELRSPRAALAQRGGALAQLLTRHDAAMRERMASQRSQLAMLAGRLAALSPLAVLERGYSVVRSVEGERRALQKASQLAPKMRFEVQMQGGVVRARVESIHLEPLAPNPEPDDVLP